MALNELSVGDLVKGGQKCTPNLSKARVSSKFDICISICQMPRPIDRAVLQRFVEKKRFLKKANTKRGLDEAGGTTKNPNFNK